MDTLASLTAVVEAPHPHQRGHSARVMLYVEAMARRLGWSPRKLDELRLGCTLHDVGKLAVAEHVLLRQGAADIPVEARLLALADGFDAMVSHRPHRPALPVEAALREMERCAGTQFDPMLADLSLRTWRSAVVDPAARIAAG